MIRFLSKIVLLICLVVAVFICVAEIPVWRFHFTNGTTESDLLIFPKNASYKLMLLGTSHGRIFSRAGDQQRVESIIGGPMINLSKGEGRGIAAEDIYLSYFFQEGNKVNDVVYLIDPFVLYSDLWNDDNDFLIDEPLDAHFLAFAIQRGVKFDVLVNYVKSKFNYSWIVLSPDTTPIQDGSLSAVDPEAVQSRIADLYPDGQNPATFQKYADRLEHMVQTAQANGARMTLIIPTTLLGHTPGEDKLVALLQTLQQKYGTRYYDLSEAITDPHLFYDHDHLNTTGVEIFAQKYIKPVLDEAIRP